MSEKDAQQPQQFSMVPLDTDVQTARNSTSSSTTPVHQVDTTTETVDGEIAPAQDAKESFPQFFVLPHLLKKNAWILLAATTVVMLVYIWLYLGSLWSPMSRVKNVEIVFYNADKGFDYSQTPPP
ncbi:hypothetical protein BGX23_006476 [Mortierella sp. AD031]|nr:hypothetical protein BGX23_006476 [Mortierella sp. AD031]